MRKKPDNKIKWADAAKILLESGVGVIPTDTVYGLVARAADIQATTRLYDLKSREKKPGTIIAATIKQLESLGFTKESLKSANGFWPGAISIVLNAGPELDYLHQETGSIAVRVVADKKLRDLLRKTGPLLTSSANQSGEPVSTTIEQAKKYFRELADFYVDGGNMSDRPPSTIIRIDGDKINIIREGAVVVQPSDCRKT